MQKEYFVEDRFKNLWELVCKRIEINEENHVLILKDFSRLCSIIKNYDSNFIEILSSIKKSETHINLLRIERNFYRNSIELRKRLNIFLNDNKREEY